MGLRPRACSDGLDKVPPDADTRGPCGSEGLPIEKILKFGVGFFLDCVESFRQKAVFWIPLTGFGSNFRYNYSVGGGGEGCYLRLWYAV